MRAIFLDRDGVICENRSDYVKSWEEFEFLPGAKESLTTLSRLGLPIIIVTNQSAIGRGIVPAAAIEDIHARMLAEISAMGGRVDQVLYCPHHPEDHCTCRKPEPGMLLQASQEHNIDLSQSYMIGDAATDIMAGQQVSCRTFIVLTGRGPQQLVHAFRAAHHPFTICRNLTGAVQQIIKAENIRAGQRVATRLDMGAYPAPTSTPSR